jgi:glycosyltransferase involved in cell wall biosynthesis
MEPGKMRIAISAQSLGRRIGGDETNRSNLLAALAAVDQINEYTIIINRSSPMADWLSQHGNFKIVRVRPGGSWYRLLWGEPWIARRSQAEIFHAQVFAPFWLTTKLVLEIPDLSFLIYPEHYQGLKGWRLRTFVPMAARRASRIITLSEAARQDIIRLLKVPGEKVISIPLGVDRELFNAQPDPTAVAALRGRYHLPDRFILYVGNIQPRKNLPRLVTAFEQLKRAGFPHKLVIVGAAQWGYEETFRKVAQSGLSREIIFTGYIPKSDLPLFYNAAELLVNPSLWEGFGLPLVEAMACGTPVAVSDCPALRETAGDAGLFFDPRNPAEIAQAIHLLLADSGLREKMIALGTEQVKSFYWEETARRTLGVYEGAAQALSKLSTSTQRSGES